MTLDALRLGLGLLTLIAVNIILGSIDALLSGAFDPGKCRRGIIKGIIVALCFAATYLVGWINPDVLAVTINGQSVNLLTAVYLVIMAGFLFYAKEVIAKLTSFIYGKLAIGELRVSDDQKTNDSDMVTEQEVSSFDTGEDKPPDVPEPYSDTKQDGQLMTAEATLAQAAELGRA